MLTKKRNALLNLCGGQMIGVAQDDTSGVFNLIVEKLAEIFHIHFAFVCIYNGGEAVQTCVAAILLHTLNCTNNVAQLSNTRWLDQNAIRMILIQCFF